MSMKAVLDPLPNGTAHDCLAGAAAPSDNSDLAAQVQSITPNIASPSLASHHAITSGFELRTSEGRARVHHNNKYVVRK
jgi:hypothetical protein